MNQLHAFAEELIPLPVDRVRAAVVDYSGVRARLAAPDFAGYRAEPGLVVVTFLGYWAELAISTPSPATVVEADRRSSLVFTWTTDGTDALTSVRLSAARDGANGVRGLVQRVTAPPRLRTALAGLLADFAAELTR
jgi:hypothetical protein